MSGAEFELKRPDGTVVPLEVVDGVLTLPDGAEGTISMKPSKSGLGFTAGELVAIANVDPSKQVRYALPRSTRGDGWHDDDGAFGDVQTGWLGPAS